MKWSFSPNFTGKKMVNVLEILFVPANEPRDQQVGWFGWGVLVVSQRTGAIFLVLGEDALVRRR